MGILKYMFRSYVNHLKSSSSFKFDEICGIYSGFPVNFYFSNRPILFRIPKRTFY